MINDVLRVASLTVGACPPSGPVGLVRGFLL